MLLLGCVFVFLVLLVRVNTFRKKNKGFKTVLINSFTLLVNLKSHHSFLLIRLLEKRHAFDWAYNIVQFLICYWEKFINLSSLHNLLYLSLLNSFSFFLKSPSSYFQMVCYRSLLSRFSVLINYTMWSFDLFTASSCFPHFSWRPGFSRSGSRVCVQVLEEAPKAWLLVTFSKNKSVPLQCLQAAKSLISSCKRICGTIL